jgi:hypothetical protein
MYIIRYLVEFKSVTDEQFFYENSLYDTFYLLFCMGNFLIFFAMTSVRKLLC